MKRTLMLLPLVLLLPFVVALSAQRPADAPATAPAGKPPDTVFLEDLTWAEVRDLVAAGTTTVIIGTAGTEQKGPHMVDGEHKFVMEYTADKIARALGKTLVAPVVTYVPEGSWENTGGHMGKPGTITLPEDRFVELLVSAGRSLKAGGFKTILLPRRVGRQPHRHADGRREAERAVEGRGARRSGSTTTTPRRTPIRTRTSPRSSAFRPTRSAATPTSSTPPRCCSSPRSTFAANRARQRLREQRRQRRPGEVDAGARQGVAADQDRQRAGADQGADGGHRAAAGRRQPGRRRRWPRRRPAGAPRRAGRPAAADDATTAPAGKTPTQAPDTVFIDELTWEETRDAMKAGKTTVIVPTGGTEKNGYHMVLGKHNYIVTHAANLMARRLKNALVAPTIQYVPEGDPDRAGPGVDLAAVAGLRPAARRGRAQPEGAWLHRHPVHRRQRRQPGRA